MLIWLINSLFGLWEIICVGIGGYYAYKLVFRYKQTRLYRGWIKFLLSKQLGSGIINGQANSPDKYDVEYHQNVFGETDRVTLRKQHKYIMSSGEVAIVQRLLYLYLEGVMYFFAFGLCWYIPYALGQVIHYGLVMFIFG